MNDFILSCCSTVDLTDEYLKNRGIVYIPFHYTLGDKDYLDDMGKTMPLSHFYKEMVNGKMTKTAQVNAEEYYAHFERFAKEGKDVVHVTLSSGLSGSYNSALIAKRQIEEKYPVKIYVVDSLGASSGFGLLMEYLATMRDEGKSAEEIAKWAEENRLNFHHWFFSTDLTFYVRGGRVSKASGWFGTLLKICPLLNMNDEGKLIPRHKIRGKKRVSEVIVEKMIEHAEKGAEYDGKCFISHSDCLNDALIVKNLVEENFPALKGKVEVFEIGTTIGSHTGPGTVALFFVGDKRTR